MSAEQTPSEILPIEQLKSYVDALFQYAPGTGRQTAVRYVGGFADQTITFTWDQETADCRIAYDAPARRSKALAHSYSFHDDSTLTSGGRLLPNKPTQDAEHEATLSDLLMEALAHSTAKPLGTLGRLMLKYHLRTYQ